MRFFFRITVVCLGLLIAALAALPWWAGPVLRQVLAGRGISFDRYERVGYARFALHRLEMGGPTWTATLERAEADTPLLWAWRHWQGQDREITVAKWSVVARPSGPPAPDAGWARLHRQLMAVGRVVGRFVPRLGVGAGRVQWPGQELETAGGEWTKGAVRLTDVKYGRWHGPVEAQWPAPDAKPGVLMLRVALPESQAQLELRGTPENVDGELTWHGQRADVTAAYAPTGWMPKSARINAADWSVPGATFGTADHYQAWRGRGNVEWQGDRFSANVDVSGDPREGSDRPAVKAIVGASGDLRAISLDAIDISVPGLQAKLSAPVRILRGGGIEAETAEFTLAGDLSLLPGGFQGGRIQGVARVAASTTAKPDILLSLTADDVERGTFRVPRLAADAVLNWPVLKVSRGSIELSPTESVAVTGTLNFSTKEIVEAEASGVIAMERIETRIGRPMAGEPVQFSGRANGPWLEPVHEGRLRTNVLQVAPVKPIALTAEWNGRGLALSSVRVTAQAGASQVTATAALEGDRATVSAFSWMRDQAEQLRLIAPVTFELRPAFTTGPFELAGALGTLQGRWTGGDQSQLTAALTGVTSRGFSDFIDLPGPTWSVSAVQAGGTWNGAVLDFNVQGTARFEEALFGSYAVTISARSVPDGIQVEELRIDVGDEATARGTAQLPITIRPAAAVPWEARPDGPIALELTAQPTGALLAWLNRKTKFDWSEPRLSAQATGTWSEPSGLMRAEARRVARETSSRLPGLNDLSLVVRFTPEALVVEDLSGRINGEPLHLTGRLRRPAAGWTSLSGNTRPAIRDILDLDMTLPETDLMLLGRDLVGSFITKGRMQGELKLQPGAGATGVFRLTGVSTRPFGTLGTLQDVSAEVQLRGDDLVLPVVQGTLGGQTVRIDGRVDGLLGNQPEWNFTLQGANLPLVRQSGLIVRADLDLRLATRQGANPDLTGIVRLRESLLLADIRHLFGRGGSAAENRAPYFSVDEARIRDWTLAVQITGERFLRIRSPVFNGVASARFRLGGTLGDPRALGEVEINEGFVILPYATFRVQQGSAELSPLHEFDPKLSLRGTTRSLGYDLRMEVSGTVTAPVATFSSSPTLSSEEALRLVLAGQAPRDEVSYSTMQRAQQIGGILGQQVLAGLSRNPDKASTLNITSGQNVSHQGKETYSIEYAFDRRWSLLGEYDEFDEYNLDLKWKLPFSRGASGHEKK